MQEFNIEKIHDTIWIFKNALKDSQDIIDYFENNRDWEDWYTFGKVSLGSGLSYNFNSFPTIEEWQAKVKHSLDQRKDDKDKYIKEKIDNLFYNATSLYLKENNISLENWVYENWNLAKYKATEDAGYIMQHHTDFQRDADYNPGNKFAVTAVFYLNDDYEGGEVEYRFVEDETLENILEDYIYKPKSGDLVVFLSGHPHYHGVKSITKGEKYIIRTYWRYNKEAHPKWKEMQEKYGEEVWKEMERERFRFNRTNVEIINNIPKFINFEEYYNRIENNKN